MHMSLTRHESKAMSIFAPLNVKCLTEWHEVGAWKLTWMKDWPSEWIKISSSFHLDLNHM